MIADTVESLKSLRCSKPLIEASALAATPESVSRMGYQVQYEGSSLWARVPSKRSHDFPRNFSSDLKASYEVELGVRAAPHKQRPGGVGSKLSAIPRFDVSGTVKLGRPADARVLQGPLSRNRSRGHQQNFGLPDVDGLDAAMREKQKEKENKDHDFSQAEQMFKAYKQGREDLVKMRHEPIDLEKDVSKVALAEIPDGLGTRTKNRNEREQKKKEHDERKQKQMKEKDKRAKERKREKVLKRRRKSGKDAASDGDSESYAEVIDAESSGGGEPGNVVDISTELSGGMAHHGEANSLSQGSKRRRAAGDDSSYHQPRPDAHSLQTPHDGWGQQSHPHPPYPPPYPGAPYGQAPPQGYHPNYPPPPPYHPPAPARGGYQPPPPARRGYSQPPPDQRDFSQPPPEQHGYPRPPHSPYYGGYPSQQYGPPPPHGGYPPPPPHNSGYPPHPGPPYGSFPPRQGRQGSQGPGLPSSQPERLSQQEFIERRQHLYHTIKNQSVDLRRSDAVEIEDFLDNQRYMFQGHEGTKDYLLEKRNGTTTLLRLFREEQTWRLVREPDNARAQSSFPPERHGGYH